MGNAGRGARARRVRRRAALACALWLAAAPAAAVVNNTGDGMGTITPPADDPGFDHVGVTGNGLSGIYVGNRWMLTAAHVGEQSLTLDGVTYPAVPGSLVFLQHSPGVNSDLVLVRLATEPPLPALELSSAAPAVGSNVTMIGRAWDRTPSEVCWDAGFTEVSCGPFATYRGYKSAGPYRMRWGRNLVDVAGSDIDLSGLLTRVFEVDFDSSGVTYEAQGVPGDSGGAVFLKRGGRWELVGVMVAIQIYTGQPHYTATMFGNETFSADVAWYRPQIDAIVNAPEIPALPLPLAVLCFAALAGAARPALSGHRRRT